MKTRKQSMVIILPLHLADLPIQIIRGSNYKELTCSIQTMEDYVYYSTETEKKHIFVWRQNDYLKLELEEIIWIEANGSYSTLYLNGNKTMVISSPLGIVTELLPSSHFMRIHRSYIINIKYVTCLTGNSLKINGKNFTIGREFRDKFLERFIFLGVRRKNK